MSISIRLVETHATIQRNMYRALARQMNQILTSRGARLRSKMTEKVSTWIMSSPEIESLMAAGPNELSAHFGLPPSQAAAAASSIVQSITSSIEIILTRIKNNLTGGIEIRVQPRSFDNLLSLGAGHVTTEKGLDLHWLDWLIIQGDKTIITNYHYSPGTGGRSGGGTMGKSGVWRVPPEHSGTPSNNFITRALSGKEAELQRILQGIFR